MHKSKISESKLEKKRYRKRYQKYIQTQEYDFLDTTFKLSKSKTKKPKKSTTNKKVEKILKEKTTVEIDLSVFLLVLKQLLISNKITKDQLIRLLAEIEDKKDHLSIKNTKFDDVDYKLTKNSDKNECRAYWLYLMEKGELFCDICGNPITTIKGPNRLTFDHILPQSKGGKTNGENASATHQVCNGLKADYLPSEWEQIGLTVLAAHKIPVDLLHCLYQYRIIKTH